MRDISLKYLSLLTLIKSYKKSRHGLSSLSVWALLSPQLNVNLNNQPPTVYERLRGELDITEERPATVLPAPGSNSLDLIFSQTQSVSYFALQWCCCCCCLTCWMDCFYLSKVVFGWLSDVIRDTTTTQWTGHWTPTHPCCPQWTLTFRGREVGGGSDKYCGI